jgi:glycyl-tRNA synthetase
VLKIPPVLAPTKLAVLPLIKKDGLQDVAKKIVTELKWDFSIAYDEKDAVGRRYRRQDALGTPFCVTVDHQSLEDNTVTLRNRDSMEQERVAISALKTILVDKVSITSLLKKL